MEVVKLRAFRDDILMSSLAGRCLISCYYRLSPPLADWISLRPRCRVFMRKFLIQPLTSRLSDPRHDTEQHVD